MCTDNHTRLFKKVKLEPRQHPDSFKHLILDEMYSFEFRKDTKCFIYTALGITDMGYRQVYARVFFAISESNLHKFIKGLPSADNYYSDGVPMYGAVLGTKVMAKKSKWTNLIESFNSQIRHYCSSLIRKTKGYSKSAKALQKSLAILLNLKFNKMVKAHYKVLKSA